MAKKRAEMQWTNSSLNFFLLALCGHVYFTDCRHILSTFMAGWGGVVLGMRECRLENEDIAL